MDPGTFRLHVTFDPVPVIIRSEQTGDIVGVGVATPRVESGENCAGPTTSATAP